jgi:hypothetical protein
MSISIGVTFRNVPEKAFHFPLKTGKKTGKFFPFSHNCKNLTGASQICKKNCSGSVSLPRDLIGSETLPLAIYKNEMLPI